MNNLGRNLALFSALIIGVSTFMTWGSVLITDVTGANEIAKVSILGIEGKDGALVLGLTIIAFLLLLIKKVPIWIPLIIAIGTLTISIVDFYALNEITAEFQGSAGSGIYLGILGSIGIVVGAIVQIVQNRKN